MIEVIILDYLKENMDVPIFLETPKVEPNKYILFEKTSSSNSDKINSATFAFQSYAMSMYEAARLNESLKWCMLGMIELDEIGKIKLNTDYNFTDTTTKKYRYQAVFDIVY